MKEFKFLVTVTQISEPSGDVTLRNSRNKTNIEYFIRTRYSTIKRRISLNKSYRKLSLCSMEEFFNWSVKCPRLPKLFKAWNDSGHPHRLIPSVDRINPDKGYVVENIRWMALHLNSSRARRKK